MEKETLLWLRAETRANEYRTPLAPQEAAKLIKKGFTVVVESSPDRCFNDRDYREIGADIVYAGSWAGNPALQKEHSWVLGLKELPTQNFDLPQRHIYFAHAFKNQEGARKLLQRFKNAGGCILDLEYLIGEKGRLVSFSYWAGYIGAALALLQWLKKEQKQKLENLAPSSKEKLHQTITEFISKQQNKLPSCLVMGAKGKVGSGAREVLQKFGIQASLWDKEETIALDKKALLEHNLFLNCVFINKKIESFLTIADLENPNQLALICDVSCDFGSAYNPLPIYQNLTSWEKPVEKIGNKKNVEIIAIDNLPSLLPKETSTSFSQSLLPLLEKLPQNSEEWQDCLSHFQQASSLI